jgi:hypothetical protein
MKKKDRIIIIDFGSQYTSVDSSSSTRDWRIF